MLNDSLDNSFKSVVQVLVMAIEAREVQLHQRAERVAAFCMQIAEQLQLDEKSCEELYYGSLLHDIGNIGIPDAILLKPTGLSDWEFREVKLHPIIGEKICKPLDSLRPLTPLIRSHHERLDGSGYPDGLRGEEIPLLVRILSVSDVYHTLRSERVYRAAFSHADSMQILQAEVERGWWDAEIVRHISALPVPEPLQLD